MLDGLWEDIVLRPYITVGFTAFVLMIPLAITSTKGWIRRLGGQRWNLLHRLVYVSASFGVLHYWWKVKLDVTNPMIYAAIVGVLLGWRVVKAITKRNETRRRTARASALSAG
jgi:sulfoxide reductase heme-binding subunit YedZ